MREKQKKKEKHDKSWNPLAENFCPPVTPLLLFLPLHFLFMCVKMQNRLDTADSTVASWQTCQVDWGNRASVYHEMKPLCRCTLAQLGAGDFALLEKVKMTRRHAVKCQGEEMTRQAPVVSLTAQKSSFQSGIKSLGENSEGQWKNDTGRPLTWWDSGLSARKRTWIDILIKTHSS